MNYTSELKKQVHEPPLFQKYEETDVRENTNCYSHALGATLPILQLYRVGEICGKKPTDEKYFSMEEIKELMFLDCDTLNLKIQESSIEEKLTDNEYKIALFVKVWGCGIIGDYHFWRYENGIWTEKWKRRNMNTIENFERDKLTYFPWNFQGIFKIQR